ncbi:MAG: hypothetical protein WC208_08450 [Gallionella sp.]|jgi:hypothetical protein
MNKDIREMRLLIAPADLQWFKDNFPSFKWESGDTTIKWNANDPDEVKMARQAFDAYKKKHPKARAFKVKKNDEKDTTSIDKFDPNAEMIIMQEFTVKG